jgi:hypothetical protein
MSAAEHEGFSRFWTKTALGTNGCIVWNAAKNEQGYGRFNYNGKNRHAHTVAYEITKEKVPNGYILMHSCDNPSCVNPDHLTVGTKAQNNLDMRNKGRARPPLNHVTRAKLTREQVEEIRTSPLGCRRLGKKYGVVPATIKKARRRVTWQ